MNSPITTHVLDTAQGCPAKNIHAVLEVLSKTETWDTVGEGTTDADGRINGLLPADAPLSPGTYCLTFDVTPYFQSQDVDSFYSSIPIVFTINNPDQHYHIPLLLSPFGYSTYRGS
jgi:5-hydroxyisourate hydrolase